jgi:hypothetical protein
MNRPQTPTPAFVTTRLFRRLVLGTALFVGLAVAFAPRLPTVHAQEPKNPVPAIPAMPAVPATPAAPAVPALPSAPPAAKSAPRTLSITDGRGAEIKIDVTDSDRPGVAAETPGASGADGDTSRRRGAKKHARVTIDGLGTDKEFDSFDEFVDNEPALFAMVIAVVAVVFFAPVLAIALILWYRMRKARMLNETMLKLAEKGIVPSPDAIDALAGGKQAAAAAPYYEQAKQVRRRAAWSDLRKGVLIGVVGLALSVHALLAYRGTNVVGLVLLFVGLGFVVLWWFEQRHIVPSNRAMPDAPPGHGPTSPGNPPLT